MERVAVLGTGLLGTGFVEGLLKRGVAVRAWNRTAAKAEPLRALGAEVVDQAAEAVAGVDRVHLVLSADDAVDATIAALRPGLAPGVPLFDHSTNAPARCAARQARLRAEGLAYFAAPVFMAPANARSASGLMLVAGPPGEVEAWTPALARMTGQVWYVGEDPARAAGYKLLGNATLLALTAVMGDALALGDAMGFTPEATLALFDHFKPDGALLNRGRRVAQREAAGPSFSMAMARKDLQLMLEAAGGGEGLLLLPGLAAAMDPWIERGQTEEDYARFAWTRPRRTP